MNILFGKPKWSDWQNALSKLPYNVYFEKFNDIDVVLKCIKDNKIDILIPCDCKQTFFVIDNMEKLSAQVKHILCNKDKKIMETLDNKTDFCKYMKRHSFAKYIPKVFITCDDKMQTTYDKLTFPCIFKLQQTAGGVGSFVLKSTSDLVRTHNKKNYLIQEYVASPNEFSGHFFVKDGDIKCFVFYMLTNKERNYIQCGRMTTYVKITDPVCIDTFTEVFKKLNYNGFACIDFRINDAGVPKIFEINPRLGGTLVNNTTDLSEIIAKVIL